MAIRQVEIRAVAPSAAIVELRRRLETWFVQEGEDFVFRSRLEGSVEVSDHLKWFQGMLRHERKLIRRLQDQGLNLVVRIYCKRLPVVIEPEGLLVAHQLRLRVEVVSG